VASEGSPWKIEKGAVNAGKATFEVERPDGPLFKFTLTIVKGRLQGDMAGERDGVVRGHARVDAARAKQGSRKPHPDKREVRASFVSRLRATRYGAQAGACRLEKDLALARRSLGEGGRERVGESEGRSLSDKEGGRRCPKIVWNEHYRR
jgi:hypothetical protein